MSVVVVVMLVTLNAVSAEIRLHVIVSMSYTHTAPLATERSELPAPDYGTAFRRT